jgi:hypothetical protein
VAASVTPSVFAIDALLLGAILALRTKAPQSLRRALGLLAVYVTFEVFGHGIAEHGAAQVMGWIW